MPGVTPVSSSTCIPALASTNNNPNGAEPDGSAASTAAQPQPARLSTTPAIPSSLVDQLFSVHNLTVCITGGSGGLGLALSRAFIQAGASVALIDNDGTKLQHAASMLKTWINDPDATVVDEKLEADVPYTCWTCDIAQCSQVESTMAQIRAKHGHLDVLINAAGYCETVPALDYPEASIKRIVDVNLNGSLFVAREFAKIVIADGIRHASIILIASMSGSIINYPQTQTPYNMTKAAVIHMAKSLSSEWASYGIRVNSLSPGYIATPLTKALVDNDPKLLQSWESRVPLARIADPNEFIGPVVFMASQASSYMTGHDLVVDGGYTVW